MGAYLPEPDSGAQGRIGVLLVNLGTPDAPAKAALRRYLGEFLADPRVVELPRWLWKPLLHGVILNTRPAKSAAKYAAIWGKDGSPLFVHTQKQAKLLRGWLGEAGLDVEVKFAMRYGNPSVVDGIGQLKAAGCQRILVWPLYPQYSGPTTGSALDALAATITRLRDVPELRTVRHFPTHPGYIAALAAAVQSHWMAQASRPDLLLMSFHGMPRQAIEQGDPYLDDCRATAQALATALGLNASQYKLTFQSRFGRGEWLKPYTAETLAELPRQGVKTLDVVCPGFSADCLETLEEIAIEGKNIFLAAGGREYRYIPALNTRPEWLAAMRDIVLSHLAGWLE